MRRANLGGGTPAPIRRIDDSTRAAPRQGREYPILTTPVAAFSELRIENFIDPTTGQLRMQQFPADVSGDDWQGDLRTLIGRVVTRDLPAGRWIEAGDLFPEGTRASSTAGIPAGYRGVVLDNEQAAGLGFFRPGDRIDIVAADAHTAADVLADVPWWSKAQEDLLVPPNQLTFGQLVATTPVCQEAIIITRLDEVRQVTELTTREEIGQEVIVGNTITRTGVAKSTEPRTFEKRLVVATVAVRAEQANSLVEALKRDSRIFCLARSSNPQATQPAGRDDLRPNDAFEKQQNELQRTGQRLVEQQRLQLERLRQEIEVLQNLLAGTEDRVHVVEHLRGRERTRDVWLDGQRDTSRLDELHHAVSASAERLRLLESELSLRLESISKPVFDR
ncbi:MAG: hypothetical protein R3B90_13735 [Planctomycetaceae bacterium]